MVFKTDVDKESYKRKTVRGTPLHKLVLPMDMKLVVSVLVLMVPFIGGTGEWSYSKLEEWPSICQTGEKQSPIALSKLTAKYTWIPELVFKNYDYGFKSSLENNGHTVQMQILDVLPQYLPTLSGANLADYILDNIHFHWESEHTIDGLRYPLEAHLVHYKKEYGNTTNAGKYVDGIVVVAIMFEETVYDNDKLDNVIAATTGVASRINTPVEVQNGFVISDLLPEDTGIFYKYEGSLTTPECNEAVIWIVLEDPSPIGYSQLFQLRNVATNTGETLTANFRELQNRNGRIVLYIR